MLENLNLLGFHNVINRCEDFYAAVEQATVPNYDVLLTNPPYSGDHMEKLLDFVSSPSNKKPWIILVPNYMYAKPYFTGFLARRDRELKQQLLLLLEKNGNGTLATDAAAAAAIATAAPVKTTKSSEGSLMLSHHPFFLVPPKRYVYITPSNVRPAAFSCCCQYAFDLAGLFLTDTHLFFFYFLHTRTFTPDLTFTHD